MSHSVIDDLYKVLETSIAQDAATPLFKPGEPVYIYGAGNTGKDVFRVLKDKGQPVAGFLDRMAQPGAEWEKTSIRPPDDAVLSPSERKRAHIIIGIFSDVDLGEVKVFLKSLGYGRITSFLSFHGRYATELGERFWLGPREFYLSHKKDVIAGYELLSDDSSRHLYVGLLKWRFTGDESFVPVPSLTDQYFPTDLPPWPSPLRMVDCGAFDGDTLRHVAGLKISVEAIAAFEPEPSNYQKMVRSVAASFSNGMTTAALFPCGVGAEAAQVRFSSGRGTSSGISETGNAMIQCVALDDALACFRPNLIKMDIESFEYDAMRGASTIIRKHRPGLAICVYHKAEHLWTIPLRGAEYLGGGKHYLRRHAHCFEFVYYWQP